nr:Peptidase S10 domain containing protein [Haemonchus contortus]
MTCLRVSELDLGVLTSKMLSFEAHEPLYEDAPCLNDTDVITYMNDAKVRKALNIPFNLPKWDICSKQVTSTYQKQYGDMAPFIKKIVAANVRVLLYYGDTDMACNLMKGQQSADQFGLKDISLIISLINKAETWCVGLSVCLFVGVSVRKLYDYDEGSDMDNPALFYNPLHFFT